MGIGSVEMHVSYHAIPPRGTANFESTMTDEHKAVSHGAREIRRLEYMPENLIDPGTLLTGTKQTMISWSQVIDSCEAVPTVYRNFFETQHINNQHFPYTLLAPSLLKPEHKTAEKLICDSDGAIHILERNGSRVVTTSFPYQTVCTVEVGSILLSSWLTLSGITSTGMASNSTIDFNTASARHFTAFLNKLRPTPGGNDENKLKAEKDKFDYLSTINFKLMNFARSSLTSGETVLQILFQPEIKEPIWSFLGRIFQRTITPAHLTILTNRELILIQDGAPGRKTRGPRYGGVWQYIPLHGIKTINLFETEKGWMTLSITVSSDETIEKFFAVSSKPALEKLCASILPGMQSL